MAKQKKTAYGIAEDGVSLKLAYLTRDGHQVSLHALEQVELSQSLYQHVAEASDDSESNLDSIMPDSNAPGELNLDDFSQDSMASLRTQPYEALFQSYSLDQGIIAINAYDEHFVKLNINRPDISQKQKTKLTKENIPHSEYKSGRWQNSVVSVNDQPELWIHHGVNQILDILETYRATQRAKYYYQLADSNETALANLFISQVPADSKETSMVLYLGNEYRRALMFEGNKWTFSLPINVTQPQPEIDVIYSKLSLALDEAHISDPENLYVCGDNCFIESVEYLRTQLPNTIIDFIHLDALFLDTETAQVYDSHFIARFILPIALAWKTLTMDNPDTIKTNFLPSYIIEGQKVFKIAWHGYLILAVLFIASLYLTLTLKQLKYDIVAGEALNKRLSAEFLDKKQQAESMLAMSRAIEQQAANIETIKSLLVGKNPWTEIITKLNNSFQNHPTSWIKNLRQEGTGFKVTGVTTFRPNIVYFSNLFPNGQILSAKYRKIRSFTVWDFEITYDYPQVDWYKMMEADAEELRKYQEEKEKTSLDKGVETSVDYKNPTMTSQAKTIVKSAVTPKTDDKVVVRSSLIDIPYPAKSLIAENNDPMVKAYKDIVTAFNAKNDWQMIDLGVKFINNYPNTVLKSYVRWYLAYRAWQNRQYEKTFLWLEPLYKNRDTLYPYTLLLSGVVYRDTKDIKNAKDKWNEIVRDYSQHQCAKTARELLNEEL